MRRMLSKKGETLYKRVELRLFSPDNRTSKKRIVIAPAGRGCILENAAKQVEDWCPTHEFSIVALGPCRFNFVSRGLKEQTA